jgi:sugar-specific transcriptional regulator TrmB
MENTILQQLGLDAEQIIVYEYLLKNGKSKAREITKNTPLKRGLVYKVLDELIAMKIVEKDDPEGAVSTFEALHPSALKTLAQSKVKEAQNAQNYLDSDLGTFISMYNLANNKPGIEFYEGLDGIKKVIYDTLTSKTTIYTYADMEQVNKYIKKLNDEYATKRDSLDLQKKVLLVDSDFTHTFLKQYKKTNLDVRFVKNVPHFTTIMQIYDNKVSYVTLSAEKMIGIIIQDKNIYEMHKALFKNMWDNAK